MTNQMSGPNPPPRPGMLDPSDPLDEIPMMTTGQATLTGRMTANARIDEYVLAGHADVSTYMHEQFRNLVMQLNAFMAEGAPETITLNDTAEVTATATAKITAHQVESVWAAVLVFWIAPMLRWLADKTDPRDVRSWRMRLTRMLDRWADWCDDHRVERSATSTESVTEEREFTAKRKIHRKVCPHIGVPMDRRGGYDLHVQWLNQSPHPLDDPAAPPLSANELMQRMSDTMRSDRYFSMDQGWGLTEEEYATLAHAGHVPLWPERPEDARVFGLPIYAPNVTTLRPAGMEGRTEASSYSLLRGVIDGHGDVWLDALAPSQTAAREALAEAIRTVRGEA